MNRNLRLFIDWLRIPDHFMHAMKIKEPEKEIRILDKMPDWRKSSVPYKAYILSLKLKVFLNGFCGL